MATGDITELSSGFRWNGTAYARYTSPSKISDTSAIIGYKGTRYDGWAEVLTIDSVTGAITSAGTDYEYDTSSADANQMKTISGSVAFVTWVDPRSAGMMKVLSTTSGNVTSLSTTVSFSTSVLKGADIYKVPLAQLGTLSYLVAYSNVSLGRGKTRLISIDGGTWVPSTVGTENDFDGSGICKDIEMAVIDSTHVIMWWRKSTNAMVARCFSVDTGTGALTGLGSEVEYEAANAGNQDNSATGLDASNFICGWYSGADTRGKMQRFVVDGSYNITLSTVYNLTSAGGGGYGIIPVFYYTDYIAVVWRSSANHGWMQTFQVDSTTGVITPLGASALRIYINSFYTPQMVEIKEHRMLLTWLGSSSDGYARAYDIEIGLTPDTPNSQII